MYKPHYLNFEVEQINVMADNRICHVILKAKFLGFKKNVYIKGTETKRTGCRKYKR